jgi:hypothetical protein
MFGERPGLAYSDVASSGDRLDLPPCAMSGKPITASRTRAQALQVLQVASEYIAGQIASHLPADVYRGSDAVRSRHSLIVSAQSSRCLLNRCRSALRA